MTVSAVPTPNVPAPNPTNPEVPAEPANQPAPAEKDWQVIAKEAISTRDAAKEKNRQLEAELSKYRTTDAQRAAEAAQAQEEAKKQQLLAEGKYKEALAIEQEKSSAAIKSLKAKLRERMVPLAIRSAAAKIPNLTTEAIDDLPKLVGDSVDIDYDTLEVVVKGPDGKPLQDEKLNPVSVDTYLAQFASKKTYLMRDAMPRSHGAAGGQGTVKATYEEALNNPALAAEWEKADPAGFKAAADEYYSPRAVTARARAGRRKLEI